MLAKLRNYLTTGLFVTGPLFMTIYFIWSMITYFDGFFMDFIPSHFFGYRLGNYTPGLGILLTLITLTTVGFITVHILGSSLLAGVDYLANRLPFIRPIYRLARQAFGVIFSSKTETFGKVVLVETPRRGIWSLGFISSVPSYEVLNKIGEDCVLVFVPTSPNPTSGLTLILPRKDVIELEMSRQEALSIVISVGTTSYVDTKPVFKRKPELSSEEQRQLLSKQLESMRYRIAEVSQDLEVITNKYHFEHQVGNLLTETSTTDAEL